MVRGVEAANVSLANPITRVNPIAVEIRFRTGKAVSIEETPRSQIAICANAADYGRGRYPRRGNLCDHLIGATAQAGCYETLI